MPTALWDSLREREIGWEGVALVLLVSVVFFSRKGGTQKRKLD